ncbi:MAG: hypothetical protein H6741_10870 [Alphaproteobacteria bacterium]|nr:hypothetical protein [Alphaproteobacteria bacterium]MCB9793218.1 hypothetical protein [Alphaproteobacteria bacterium]
MKTLAPLALLALLGCRTDKDQPVDSDLPSDETDLDQDGYAAPGDCDDEDPSVNPGAAELCDGLDNDCDGEVDEPGAEGGQTFYVDADGDGYGDTPVVACSLPEGAAELGGDCDDEDPAYNPGAEESDCSDPNDYNCDGSVGYADSDGDGYAACEECDDGDAAVNPRATEICDGVDNDCDGEVDAGAVDASTFWQDADGDGYGDVELTETACEASEGYVDNAEDCDDGAASTYPGAEERCDGVDQDCDSSVDEDAADAATWYADADGDGYGNAAYAQAACEAPSGYADNDGDCDDGEPLAWSGAAEACDEVDNDCDASVDEGVESTWYLDADQDGYGDDARSAEACSAPTSAYVASGGDCDDGDDSAYPSASEECDEVDNDCDSAVDEDFTSSATTWYADGDGDGYGDAGASLFACDQPSGYVLDDTDCDDGDGGANPGASEACDGVDNDCNGTVDDDSEVLGLSGCAAASCEELLPYTSTDGLYYVDPDGAGEEELWCEMDRDSGGWTLIAVVSDDGTATWTWNNRDYWGSDTTTFGSSADLSRDYKASAYHRLLFEDLLFVHSTPGDPTNPDWAAYHGVGDGSQDLGSHIDAIPERTLYSNGDGAAMAAGTLSTSSTLCTTRLVFNACGRDGSGSCADADDTHGPTWNINNNNGCPYDDTGPYGGMGPHRGNASTEWGTLGFGWALGINTGSAGAAENYMEVYAR